MDLGVRLCLPKECVSVCPLIFGAFREQLVGGVVRLGMLMSRHEESAVSQLAWLVFPPVPMASNELVDGTLIGFLKL